MKGLRLLLLVALMAPWLAAYSSEDATRDWLQAGIDAFDAGRYEQALAYFDRAAEQGPVSTALIHNRAVAHYRAGNLDEARGDIELLLEQGESQQLARYNLGLVALAADQPESAYRHFLQVTRADGGEELRHLARQQLERLETPADPAPTWQGLVSVSGGYEDNLNLASERTQETGDGFGEVIAYGSGYLLGDAARGLRLSGVVTRRDYFSETDSRQQVARPALAFDWRLDDWRHSLVGDAEWAWLGGDRVERRDRFQVKSRRNLGAGQLRGAAGYARIRAGSAFSELDGREAFFEAGYRHHWDGSLSATVTYRHSRNDRDDLQEDGFFFSFSPVRHRVDLRLSGLEWAGWHFSPRVQYRFSRFRDEDRDEEGQSLGRRKEHRARVAGFIERPLNDRWHVFLLPEWELNNANRADRDYRRFEVQAGIEWRW